MSHTYAFISYSRQDRPFVEHLTAELREAGVRTWTDLDNISAGQDWAREIDRGLLEATVLIYVASKNSALSRWMNAEYTALLEKAKRVIPIVTDDDGPANLPEPVCTENPIGVDDAPESPLSWRNDRAPVFRRGRLGLAIQVEDPA
jgi:TIR domain